MEPWLIILISALAFLLISGGLFSFFYTMKIAKKVYRAQMVRETPSKWPRECTALDNEEQVAMWNEGMDWANQYKDKMKEVHVKNGDLNLYGEFYNFGFNKTAFILPGRPETLCYAYYFAKGYEKIGYNVLVIDNRAVGKSDGLVNTCGILESHDYVIWIKYLREELHQEKVITHSICVGGVGAIKAYRKDESLIDAFIIDGLFINFKETFKNHMIDLNRPIFPVFYELWHFFKKDTGHSINESAPIKDVPYMKKPVLFLYTRKDIFSKPDKSQLMFDKCGSENKEIKWFDKGLHSHIKINNEDEYNATIKDFLSRNVR